MLEAAAGVYDRIGTPGIHSFQTAAAGCGSNTGERRYMRMPTQIIAQVAAGQRAMATMMR